jgi:hypothetical protein
MDKNWRIVLFVNIPLISNSWRCYKKSDPGVLLVGGGTTKINSTIRETDMVSRKGHFEESI